MTEVSEAMRILVIDDNPDDRQLEIREVLAVFPNADIVELSNIVAFDAALEQGAPDLVLTDLDLRWSNGGEVLMRVKTQYPACPVVMFTGTGNETIAVDLMKAGLDDYVVKSARQLGRLRTSLKMAVELAKSRAALTDRELQLSRALAQQQTTVRELHHRVKNNLQIMASLLHLRARTVDEITRGHLDELAGRMEALGAVQSRMYVTMQLDRVDFRLVLADIASTLVHVHRNNDITLETAFDIVLDLDVNRAMPLSLLCYEIVLNALKHAWPEATTGTLTVSIVQHHEAVEICITDDGVGFVESATVDGLGTRLTRALANDAKIVLTLASRLGLGTCVILKLL